ncbi:hypothetical protein KKI24_12575 [bacterium]|nr:hypothetical protein [bacterium]
MDFKEIPFSNGIFDPSFFSVNRDDFESLIKQEFFYFDESGEAVALMSDADKASVAEFDSRYS